jgi:2-amino-4-hydroxy-6-hydroxymethyldihydropteridine diphosphokinase
MCEHPARPLAVEDGPVRAYVGLGSNQGDSEALLAEAVRRLGDLPDTRLVAVSGLYLTSPIGGPEQPSFLNMVVALDTSLTPFGLLEASQRIEDLAGRTREVRWGPRTLDVDILWYHSFEGREESLQVPHPRMEERRFVLEPLAEIAPGLVLPSGRTVCEALQSVQDQLVRRLPSAIALGEEDAPCHP